MDIVVKSKNCEVPAKVKEDALAKVQHAARFFDRLLAVEMVFSAEQNPRIAEPAVVELTGRTKRHHIRALGSGENHRNAVDAAVSRFERQLARYKARLVDRSRGRQRSPAPAAASAASPGLLRSGDGADDGWPTPRIVRTKQFELIPMLPEDAALQLELLGHDFYMFTNAATGRCSVLYRRRDGDLGLIEQAAGAGSHPLVT